MHFTIIVSDQENYTFYDNSREWMKWKWRRKWNVNENNEYYISYNELERVNEVEKKREKETMEY